jgi:cytochrome c biogenesis protein CcdA
MENNMRFLALGVCALALISASASAQASAAVSKGPTLQAAAVGFRVSNSKVDASRLATAPIVRRHQGQDVAFMAVGVGAMIAGALIGDTAGTIIIIGGAAMALVGLYHYLE